MKFRSSLVVLASLVSAALSATVADVIADTRNISTQVTNLDNAANAFPNTGGSLVAALAIHTDTVNLGSAFDKGITDIISASPKPFSEADGTTLLDIVEGFEPILLDALKVLIAKKAAFQALPIGGIPALIKQDLINLNASANTFENQLIASLPTDLVAAAEAIKADLGTIFVNAIAAYQ
ncbi:hydrophobic surface binding protein [Agrocybe pediades]|nr:hydrophobic surface binding protein [Agrocybe pediades]